MANQTDYLRALENKEALVTTEDLAKELKTTGDSVRPTMAKLKKKGLAEGSSAGWRITDVGREFLKTGASVPETLEDTGKDELSKFRYYGMVAGAEADDIAAAAELFASTNRRDLTEMERCLAEAAVPQVHRPRWIALYRNYLRDTTPMEDRDIMYPLPRAREVTLSNKEAGGPERRDTETGDSLDYIVEGLDIHRVESGFGDFTFRQAIQAVAAKRTSASRGSAEGETVGVITALANALKNSNPNQPVTVKDLIDLAKELNEAKGGGGGNEGTRSHGYFDENLQWHDIPIDQPIVMPRSTNPGNIAQGKTIVYKQTEQGLVKQEYNPGDPIIIETGAPASGNGSRLPTSLPFPIFGSDGKPVTDSVGNPVYANIGPMMQWLGFMSEEKRKTERHDALVGLVQTVKENVGDGIQALKMAATNIKSGKTESKTETPAQEKVYECGSCHAQFTLPNNPNWAELECPSCHKKWTREEVLKL